MRLIVTSMDHNSEYRKDLAPMEQEVLNALRLVKDPDLNKDIVALEFVKNLNVAQGKVSFTIELTTPACPVRKQMEDQARAAVMKVKGVREVEIQMSSRVTSGRSSSGKQDIEGV